MKTLTLMVASAWLAVASTPAADIVPACCREGVPGGELTDGSLYQLESKWTSDFGKEVSLDVFHGRPQIVVMFFASCDYACPILTVDLKRIAKALPEEHAAKAGFVFISFDSDRDTPEVLNEFRAKWELPVETCALLRGKPDDVREMAALLGVNYLKDSKGNFSHSNLITLLDADGEVVYQQPGLNKPPDAMVQEIGKLLN